MEAKIPIGGMGKIKERILGDLAFPGGSVVENLSANAGDLCSIPGLGRSPRGGNDNPLQYPCLGNPKDRGAWWVTVRGITKSQTQLGMPTHAGGSVVKNTPANAGDLGSTPGPGSSPEGGNGSPFQYSCLGNPIERGAGVGGYSPWGCKELDPSEWLNNNIGRYGDGMD